MADEKLAYSIKAAANAADSSKSSIYRAAARGELILSKRGRKTVILADELRRWVSSVPTAKTPRKAA